MKHLFVITRACLFLMVPIITFSSCGGKKTDEQIQTEVQDKISTRGEGGAENQRNINVTVKDGVVSLTGDCIGDNCADSLVAQVKDIDGVKNVESNVRQVQAETDLTLRTSVQSIISKYQGVQADVAGGVVVLRGTIQRDQLQPLMNELGNLQAKKIDNQLAVQ